MKFTVNQILCAITLALALMSQDIVAKVTLSMCVKNEASHYLRMVMQEVRPLIDEAVIIDDASTDDTVNVIYEELYGIPVHIIRNPVSKFSNEVNLRKQQWNETVKTNPEWILNIDADHVFERAMRAEIKKLTQQNTIDVWSFRLYDFWDMDHYRDDVYWSAHNTYRPFLIRYKKDFNYVWKETPQHCGHFPMNVMALPNGRCEMRLKHYGWASEQDRLAKYKRYQELDPGAKYGWKEQYESILDKNPHVVKWEELIHKKQTQLRFVHCKNKDACSLNDEFMEMIASLFKYPIFVETGTFTGNTTTLAAPFFNTVHSIELSDKLFEFAKRRFGYNKNIRLYHGDSVNILPEIVKTLTQKTIFFLDAHFSGNNTAKGNENTPILSELEIIKKSGIKNSIIIVDDFRLFYEPLGNLQGTNLEGYPTTTQIINKILEIDSTYRFAIVSDVLIAYPETEAIIATPVTHAATMSRLFDGTNLEINDVIAAEYCIAHAQGEEKEAIEKLAQLFVNQDSITMCIARHYPLWYGLTLLADGNYEKALVELKKAKQAGLTHWRIDWYISMAESHSFSMDKKPTAPSIASGLTELPHWLHMLKETNPAIDTVQIKQIIKRLLPENPVILEAGAHEGGDTVQMAKIWPKGTIYAFEPVPGIFKTLQLKTSNFTNVHVYDLALSNSTGTTKFYISSGDSDCSSSLLEPKEHLKYHPTVYFRTAIDVQTCTLDEWAAKNNVDHVDFMWLDMQGSELDVLKASPNILSTVSIIYTEVNFCEAYKGCPLYPELRAWLESQGFVVAHEDLHRWADFGDVLFIRKNK